MYSVVSCQLNCHMSHKLVTPVLFSGFKISRRPPEFCWLRDYMSPVTLVIAISLGLVAPHLSQPPSFPESDVYFLWLARVNVVNGRLMICVQSRVHISDFEVKRPSVKTVHNNIASFNFCTGTRRTRKRGTSE